MGNEDNIKQSDQKKEINIALSGGGLRASLFGLGALLYAIDSGVNERVRVISSVSGGSITNAYIGQECDFRKVKQEEFEKIAGRLIRLFVKKGLLWATWWSVVYAIVIGLGALFLLSILFLGWPFYIAYIPPA